MIVVVERCLDGIRALYVAMHTEVNTASWTLMTPYVRD